MKIKLHHYLFASLAFESVFIVLFLVAAWMVKATIVAQLLVVSNAMLLGLKAAYMLSHQMPKGGISDGVIYFVDLLGGINYLMYVFSSAILHAIVWYERDFHNVTEASMVLYYILAVDFVIITVIHVVAKVICYKKYNSVIVRQRTLTQVVEDEQPLIDLSPHPVEPDTVNTMHTVDGYKARNIYPGLY